MNFFSSLCKCTYQASETHKDCESCNVFSLILVIKGQKNTNTVTGCLQSDIKWHRQELNVNDSSVQDRKRGRETVMCMRHPNCKRMMRPSVWDQNRERWVEQSKAKQRWDELQAQCSSSFCPLAWVQHHRERERERKATWPSHSAVNRDYLNMKTAKAPSEASVQVSSRETWSSEASGSYDHSHPGHSGLLIHIFIHPCILLPHFTSAKRKREKNAHASWLAVSFGGVQTSESKSKKHYTEKADTHSSVERARCNNNNNETATARRRRRIMWRDHCVKWRDHRGWHLLMIQHDFFFSTDSTVTAAASSCIN